MIKKLVHIIAILFGIIPIITHFLERNYIASVIYILFFIYILNPIINKVIKNDKKEYIYK